MKKYIIISVLAFTIISFGSCNEKKKSKDDFKLNESNLSALEQKISDGKKVYEKTCQACHQADGKGVEGTFPPLVSSDYFANDKMLIIHNIFNGLKGEITVNGKKYNAEMPKQILTDIEATVVATYVLNSFENKGGEISIEEVKNLKK